LYARVAFSSVLLGVAAQPPMIASDVSIDATNDA
jgi:hypothetical protein